MYKVSDAFAEAMANRPYSAKITLDDTDVIQSKPGNPNDPINGITFRGGTNGNNEGFALGGTVSASVEIVLNREQVSCAFTGRQVKVELGMNEEPLPMGVYYVTEPLTDDDLLTVTAYDALGSKFEREYETLPGFSFDAGVSSVNFLRALCDRRGVKVDVSNLVDVQLKVSPDGFTERQIIGFIAALNGGFAVVDRTGILRIRSYTDCNAKVTPDNYYEGGLEKADYVFSVQWIKCYNEAADLTMIMGDTTASQGIYLESIWMTNAILADLWEKLQGFSYTPVLELSFFGNPLIDAGDIITLEDLSGESIKIPVMKITHEYDGGVLTRVAANGQSETTNNAGAVKGQIQRAVVQAKKYTDSENVKLDQVELLKRLTQEWLDDALYLTKDGRLAIKATAILAGILSSDRIDTKDLFAKDITMTGKFESTAEAYLPPTYDDAVYLMRHLVYPGKYPLPEGYSFDLNGDGKLDENDALMAMRVYEGKLPMSDCPGAARTPVTVRINMSNPGKTIHIFGTNMWGTYVETFIGADVNNCSFASKERLERMINQDVNDSYLYRIVDGEKEYFNPPMCPGEEYRTIERWNQKPVYTMLYVQGPIQGNDDGPAAEYAFDSGYVIRSAAVGINEETGERYVSPYHLEEVISDFRIGTSHNRIVVYLGTEIYLTEIQIQLWYTKEA